MAQEFLGVVDSIRISALFGAMSVLQNLLGAPHWLGMLRLAARHASIKSGSLHRVLVVNESMEYFLNIFSLKSWESTVFSYIFSCYIIFIITFQDSMLWNNSKSVSN